MEKDKVFEKQKADRAAANANAGSSNGRKDEPWLTEDIIVKVPIYMSFYVCSGCCSCALHDTCQTVL